MGKVNPVKKKSGKKSGAGNNKLNPPKQKAFSSNRNYLYGNRLWIIILAAATIISYLPVFNNEFIVWWDDGTYIVKNDFITTLNIKAVFTEYYGGNYHPFVGLTNIIEYYFFGENPLIYHLNNLILHVLNTILVMFFIKRLFNRLDIAVIVSVFFGVHPMHVESVAWAAERKDVLYTFFFLLSLIYYLKHVSDEKKGYMSYSLSLIYLFCSLMSKSAAVVLPLVLVIIDWLQGFHFDKRRILEKIPFFILSLLFGIIALYSQKRAMESGSHEGIFYEYDKIFLSSYAVIVYWVKAFIPIKLSAIYAYPSKTDGLLPIMYYVASAVIMIVTVSSIFLLRKTKIFLFSIMFFFITVILVLQILPVGGFLIAERYTYVPYIGLFIIPAYLYSRIENLNLPIKKILIISAKTIIICTVVLFMVLTFMRVRKWQREDILFIDVIEKTGNYLGYSKTASYYYKAQDYDNALKYYSEAIKIFPHVHDNYKIRGVIYFYIQKYNEAIEDLSEAIKSMPENDECFLTRAVSYSSLNKFQEALPDYNRYFELRKESADADPYLYRAIALINLNKLDSALLDLNMFLSFESTTQNKTDALTKRGIIYFNKGKFNEAIDDFSSALVLSPSSAFVLYWRALTYHQMRKIDRALEDYTRAISIDPDYGMAYLNRGKIYLEKNMNDLAAKDFENARKLGAQ